MSEMDSLILRDSLLQHVHGRGEDSLEPDVIQPGGPDPAPGGHGGAPGRLQQERHLSEIISRGQSFVVFPKAINCYLTKMDCDNCVCIACDIPLQNKEEVFAIVPLCDNLMTIIKLNFFQGVSNCQALPFVQLVLKSNLQSIVEFNKYFLPKSESESRNSPY